MIPHTMVVYSGHENTIKCIQYLFSDLNEVEVTEARYCGDEKIATCKIISDRLPTRWMCLP